MTKASLARILDLLSVGRSTSSTKCNLKEVIKTVGDAKLLDIDISNLVEVDGGVSEQADLSEDKEALRERLRLMRVGKERQRVQRVGEEEQVRLEKADKQARIVRVENLLQKVRTDLSEKRVEVGVEVQDSGTNAEVGSNVAKDVHECQKCGEHLQEASIEMWEHYTNHYKSAILRFLSIINI